MGSKRQAKLGYSGHRTLLPLRGASGQNAIALAPPHIGRTLLAGRLGALIVRLFSIRPPIWFCGLPELVDDGSRRPIGYKYRDLRCLVTR